MKMAIASITVKPKKKMRMRMIMTISKARIKNSKPFHQMLPIKFLVVISIPIQ